MTAPFLNTGDTPTAANWNAFPRGILVEARVTANQTGIGGTFVVLTGLSVTPTLLTSRKILITAQVQVSVDTVSDTTANLAIVADGTVLQGAAHRPVGSSRAATVTSSIVHTPSLDSVTYDLRLRRTVGTGTLTMHASSASPAFILVEDLGPA